MADCRELQAVIARTANQDRCSLLQEEQLTYLTGYRKVPTIVAAAATSTAGMATVIMPL